MSRYAWYSKKTHELLSTYEGQGSVLIVSINGRHVVATAVTTDGVNPPAIDRFGDYVLLGVVDEGTFWDNARAKTVPIVMGEEPEDFKAKWPTVATSFVADGER